MTEEIKEPISNASNPEALARVFERIAERCDAIVAERRRESAERKRAEVAPDAG